MKAKLVGKIVAVTEKEGKTGKYNSVVLIVDSEVLNTYTKNPNIQTSNDLQEVVIEMKKFKGQWSSFQILDAKKLN